MWHLAMMSVKRCAAEEIATEPSHVQIMQSQLASAKRTDAGGNISVFAAVIGTVRSVCTV
jgi:hypothetical protein